MLFSCYAAFSLRIIISICKTCKQTETKRLPVEESQRVENVVIDNYDDNDTNRKNYTRRIIVNDQFDGTTNKNHEQNDNNDQDYGQFNIKIS